MKDLQNEGVINRVKELCHETRANFLEVAALLYKIREEEAWRGFYSSFNEFVDDCQLSRSFASKLVRVHEVFVIQSGISAPKLITVGHEKLYDAIPLLKNNSAYEVLMMADTYSQKEIREIIKACEHEPDLNITFHPCKNVGCSKFLKVI